MDKKIDKNIIAIVAIVVVAAVVCVILLSGLREKTTPINSTIGDINWPNCYSEGQSRPNVEGAPGCCAGLDAVSFARVNETGGCVLAGGTSLCTDCGNGVCDTDENKCNCPADCENVGGGIGLPNPASVYCNDQGGNLTIVDTPEGQVGMCSFPNGQTCEEWALFRSNATNCTGADSSPAKTYCKPEQRGAEMCTREYHAVCGWSAECEYPPCTLQIYSNPCQACIQEEVAYWTEGECPA